MDRRRANDECGMTSDELKTEAISSFITRHSAFIISYHPVRPR
jgi:hypothetical protein